MFSIGWIAAVTLFSLDTLDTLLFKFCLSLRVRSYKASNTEDVLTAFSLSPSSFVTYSSPFSIRKPRWIMNLQLSPHLTSHKKVFFFFYREATTKRTLTILFSLPPSHSAASSFTLAADSTTFSSQALRKRRNACLGFTRRCHSPITQSVQQLFLMAAEEEVEGRLAYSAPLLHSTCRRK